ncbi:TRAP transporter substrate-binding protein [Peptoniphilus sp. KCTC 25270]|uniref:TRAP transporter substrate-binding protein n=1 Tax=Peptoniphilus sp. KCTC 25270 TaxID=2897414 RepID=UPI001E2DB381|nr:TRAP transporter substrate-binding protein [Peptoniphilus sp. KCTC 25270]MCD1146633.1 TRAP transporter substrate-binding protein [Peptoniphilus sp. KCTC 25270]
MKANGKVKSVVKSLSISLLLCLLVVAGIFAKERSNLSQVNEDEIVVRIGHVAAEGTPIDLGCLKFKELLEERSGNKFDVRVYPNGQLGGDRQSIESVALGYLTGSLPGAGAIAGFEPRFMVSDLPFLYKEKEDAFMAFDNELGGRLDTYLSDLGIHSLGYCDTGYRYITTNGIEIKKPEDLKGIKIRTMENPIHIDSFIAWGASPTPMNFSEVFTGLQQGAVDAQENPLQITISSRFYEVQDTLSLTGHFYAYGPLIVGQQFMESLSEEDRQLVNECGREAVLYERYISEKMEEEYLEEAKSNGMNLVELTPEEKNAFIESASDVYEDFYKQYADGKDLVELARQYEGEGKELYKGYEDLEEGDK